MQTQRKRIPWHKQERKIRNRFFVKRTPFYGVFKKTGNFNALRRFQLQELRKDIPATPHKFWISDLPIRHPVAWCFWRGGTKINMLQTVFQKRVCISASHYKLVKGICFWPEKSLCAVCHSVAHSKNSATSTVCADFDRKTQRRWNLQTRMNPGFSILRCATRWHSVSA